jgi:choline dehydrogenase
MTGGVAVSGPDHEDVVDSQPRVDELRTVDCLALPTMLAGNVDGPIMAMAWRAADFILDDQ